jgi:hypothetical protein
MKAIERWKLVKFGREILHYRIMSSGDFCGHCNARSKMRDWLRYHLLHRINRDHGDMMLVK